MTLIKNCFLSVIVMSFLWVIECHADETCDSGYYLEHGGCLPCPRGYACDGINKNPCDLSQFMYTDEEGQSHCSICGGSSHSHIHIVVDDFGVAVGCVTTSCGTDWNEVIFAINGTEIPVCKRNYRCPAGFFRLDSETGENGYCVLCPKGYACTGGNAGATQCRAANGEYTNSVGKIACDTCIGDGDKIHADLDGNGIDCSDSCRDGYEQNGDRVCKICDVKKFSVDGAACSSCLTGYTTIGVDDCVDSTSGLGCSKCKKMDTKMCFPSSICVTWPDGLIIGKVNANNIKVMRTKPNTHGAILGPGILTYP